MKDLIDQIIADFEQRLIEDAKDPDECGGLPIGKPTLKVLGQMSLWLDEKALATLGLAATGDLDALIEVKSGVIRVRRVLKESLAKHGIDYDDLSGEIWIPDNAEFLTYYSSDYVDVVRLDPVSALTAKAVKAPRKNKPLIEKALKLYGDELAENIVRHGGSLDEFSKTKKLKL